MAVNSNSFDVSRQLSANTPSSWMMWVDGVGGFLICRGPSAWLGRLVVDPHVEIPLAAEIERRHAKLVWKGGRHWLLPTGKVWVNGVAIPDLMGLRHGDQIDLNDAVSIRYRQPPLLGDTALLDLLTPVRSVPGCNGIVLLEQTLVLGKSPAAHIHCEELGRPLILVHRQGDLYVKSSQWFEVDGRRARGLVPLPVGSRLACEELALKLEWCR